MADFKKEMLGVVSEGTLREVDLATALINTYYRMRQLGFIEYKDIDALHVNDLEFFRRMIASGKMDMGEDFIKEEFWYHFHEVEDAVDDVCISHGCQYTSHPDDPACIGIWEVEEE
jgi:hypothetical protein